MRKQYLDAKARYPDAVLLFRLGDFYETFDQDARTISRDLEIVLTRRDVGNGEVVPLAGIPHHSLETYLGKLVRKGHRVAICEQMSEPNGRTLVDRDVVRVVTPGTVIEPTLLDQGANNFLVAIVGGQASVGIGYVDISTGEFAVTEVEGHQVAQEIARLAPTEVLVPNSLDLGQFGIDSTDPTFTLTNVDGDILLSRTTRERLTKYFGVHNLESFGCEQLELAATAAAIILRYVEQTYPLALSHLTGFHTYSVDNFMVIDSQTRKTLELFGASYSTGHDHSLLSVLDQTLTPLGKRLLRNWVSMPLLDMTGLVSRQESISYWVDEGSKRKNSRELLSVIGDVERVIQRISTRAVLPREVLSLGSWLEQIPKLHLVIGDESKGWMDGEAPDCGDVVSLIREVLADDTQGELGQGGVIRSGFSDELDRVRTISTEGRAFIAGLERRERERTGIANLKVGYNKVFGYYLEVTNSQLSNVPEDYVRRQTLSGGERFYTPELKEYENTVLNAREEIQRLETDIFREACGRISSLSVPVLRAAKSVAVLDVLISLAEVAVRGRYVRPSLNNDGVIDIKSGRHPVVESFIPDGVFVPNDTQLSVDSEQIVLLTGPNMAGKSTYLRQVAIITLMAHIGSFVPASEANIGLVDRIFTRVGLQDDVSSGRSTFMVEMLETAAILNHATKDSLLILDEIGRGTSTYDGLSIAQAVVEYIHQSSRLGCRTLFATHYHELTQLADRFPRIHNFNVAVDDSDGIIFLHRIVPGASDRSYGVHVADMAGLPFSVVNRSRQLLLEHEHKSRHLSELEANSEEPVMEDLNYQLPLVEEQRQSHAVLASLMSLDLNQLTPIDAFNKLFEMQDQARGDK